MPVDNLQAVILCGGLGTRLGGLSRVIPKAMTDIHGKPFLEHQINFLKRFGFHDFVLLTGHKGELVEEYFKDGSELGVSIKYSREESNLGTGGAVRKALKLLRDNFMLAYGDSFLPMDYETFAEHFQQTKTIGLLAVSQNPTDTPLVTSNNLALDEKGNLAKYEKGSQDQSLTHLDAGVMAFHKKKLAPLLKKIQAEKFSLETVIFPQLIKERQLAAHIVQQVPFDIGTHERLENFRRYLSRIVPDSTIHDTSASAFETAFESVWSNTRVDKVFDLSPKMLPITFDKAKIGEVMTEAKRQGKWVLAFVIGTKPCYYKFYGAINAAKKAGLPYIIIDSEQHYDPVLTHGRTEFGTVYGDNITITLGIRGPLSQKAAELLLKISWLAQYFKQKWPDVEVMPVVLGDTILTSTVPAAWMFSINQKAIQNEAGLRAMTPELMRRVPKINVETFLNEQFLCNWSLLRNEPFPEQWNTFVSAAGCEYLFTPLELNKQNLLREGYPEDRIHVIGGVVVDALKAKMNEKTEQSVFDVYPALEEGEWIRVDIHRKENITPRRFRTIIGTIADLVKKGHKVSMVEMNATKFGIDQFGLRHEIEKLQKQKNFLLTPVWPTYGHVLEFYNSEHCLSALTDSGGVQEELNMLGKPCWTARFSTDRPETVNLAHSNVLVPPVSREFMTNCAEHLIADESLAKQMRMAPKLYGNNAGEKFIRIVDDLMTRKERTFSWAHETLGLWDENEKTDFL